VAHFAGDITQILNFIKPKDAPKSPREIFLFPTPPHAGQAKEKPKRCTERVDEGKNKKKRRHP
jgi:hypothetical protein